MKRHHQALVLFFALSWGCTSTQSTDQTIAAPAATPTAKWVHSQPANIHFTEHEITVGEYEKCVKSGQCSEENFFFEGKDSKTRFKKDCNWGIEGRSEHPMNCVDWQGAVSYCAYLGARLPTRDEWMAEATNQGERTFPWGNEEITCERAVWRQGCGKNTTSPVCSKPQGKSVSGLCDLSGNVWEWTTTEKKLRNGRITRAMVGGSWDQGNPKFLKSESNLYRLEGHKLSNNGFRCASENPL